VKTFYLFCKCLCNQEDNKSLSSTVLNDYILSEQKRNGIQVNNKFNPQGWFGQAWTDWQDVSKNEKLFRSEYYEILIRSGEEPYSYQIKPEYFDLLKEIFAELETAQQRAEKPSTEARKKINDLLAEADEQDSSKSE
jgi:hypothetical protein